MKKAFLIMAVAIMSMLFSTATFAQGATQPPSTTHYVKLTWNVPSDSNTTTNYKVYVDTKACPTSGVSSTAVLANPSTAISGTTYFDVEPLGTYCYYVTAVTNGTESAPSNTAGATIRPFAPSGTVAIPN